MTRETIVNGRAGRIDINDTDLRGAHFRYAVGGEVTEGDFSIACVGGGYSVLIGGRAIRVVPDESGSFLAGGRTLAVEIFDPRDLRAKPDHAAVHGSRQLR